MEPNSPRKIQFTVPLLEPHLDPEAAEQIRRRRPTPANLVLSSDQSSPEIDEDRLPNPLLKSGLAMSPRQRKKVSRSTPTMKELQMMVEHHLCKQAQGGDDDDEVAATARCHRGGDTEPEHRHSPGPAPPGHRTPGDGTPQAGTPRAGTPQAGTPQAGTPRAGTPGAVRRSRAEDGTHIEPGDSAGSGH
ncbi:protein phosphatase 1 regulatory subunit 1A [Ammospiza nelsoni]|uniref:protein phosphatase 1 regulatory subunit 1A n=1 Tax=Melozone crissalis TaxID=40204 RepID=UPI0023DB6609|nr:protein phosphatase 1 regulatory subunit 1A [Melozone crissalis]XP_057898179.1 protein phosphatase 1 regulatory subunit 1A [Melospiza georgiana]XP_058678203.1 protein phosphatase 1 regulatory subunit 1A [Ammospiza caudacuta]XP_058678204.1 protein phosphatase 1 regulatory subunit 1A [Ammospiza caudacuta]XP_059347315.1 protein phosphatase 1 regulatory subunit 1A [Ammospiza nelsoni]XP_059347316.1 protein phosphatase 1 regulatory subunit 1A [Ammospiza nelsoni]